MQGVNWGKILLLMFLLNLHLQGQDLIFAFPFEGLPQFDDQTEHQFGVKKDVLEGNQKFQTSWKSD